jgi:hypothetical protein
MLYRFWQFLYKYNNTNNNNNNNNIQSCSTSQVACNGNHINVFRKHQQQASKHHGCQHTFQNKTLSLIICATHSHTHNLTFVSAYTDPCTTHTRIHTQTNPKAENLTTLNYILSCSCTLTTTSSFNERDIWRKFYLYDAEFMKGPNKCMYYNYI